MCVAPLVQMSSCFVANCGVWINGRGPSAQGCPAGMKLATADMLAGRRAQRRAIANTRKVVSWRNLEVSIAKA